MGVRMVAVTKEEGTRVEISCDGYSSCRARFTTVFRSADPKFEEISEFVRSLGWAIRDDGRMLCVECARYMP
jgi:hypothetical protein